jgi:hypothetical protein
MEEDCALKLLRYKWQKLSGNVRKMSEKDATTVIF